MKSKTSLFRRAFIAPVKFYQKHISPYKQRCCRFYPTCSAYAAEAIEKRGVLVGLALAAARVVRCNPFCRGGYDPVPEKKKCRLHGGDNKQENI